MKTFQIKKISFYTLITVSALLLTHCSKDDPKDPEPQQILGCMDPDATNYNANATESDNSCTYTIAGCTNPLSNNYNENATEDDGTCLFNCTDPNAENYNENATADNGTCSYGEALSNEFKENPEQYTQNILIEPFVGTWNGWSVDVSERIAHLKDLYNSQIIASFIYQGSEGLTNQPFYTHMDEVFDVKGFPSGLVNRRESSLSEDVVMSRSEWSATVVDLLNSEPPTGIAISAKVSPEDVLEVFVEVGFSEAIEDVVLQVFLIEDEVYVEEAQENYYSHEYGDDFAGHPFYDQPASINGYEHNDVFRQSLTGNEGVKIPNDVITTNGKFQRKFVVEDAGAYYQVSDRNFKIIAFASKTGTEPNEKFILNAQQLSIKDDGTLAVQDYD